MLVPGDVGGGDLVAIALPPGTTWLPLLETLWARGASILPVDPRLADAERARVLTRANPTVVLDASGSRRSRPSRDDLTGIGLVMHTSGTAG